MSTFKKFHKCNAYTRDTFSYGARRNEFVSYTTKIAEWYESGSPTHVNELLVSCCFNHSSTTIRQFSRWLKEYNVPCSYSAINKLYKNCGMIRNGISRPQRINGLSVRFCNRDYSKDDYGIGGYYGVI